MRLTIKLGVFIFWLVMAVLLIKKEVVARYYALAPAQPVQTPAVIPFREDWMGIYYNQRKIGYSNTILKDLSKDSNGLGGYAVYHNTFLSAPVLGELKSIEINGNAFLDEGLRLQALQFSLKSGDYIMNVKGRLQDDKIYLTLSNPPDATTQEMVIDRDVALFSNLNPSLFLQSLLKTKSRSVKIFDPLTLSISTASINFLGKEKYFMDNKRLDVFVLEISYQGITVKTWVDQDGKILKQESPLGLVIIREPQGKATDMPAADASGKDILTSVSIPSNLIIGVPQELKGIKLELKGVDLRAFDFSGPRQKVVFSSAQRTVAIINREELTGFVPLALPIRALDLGKFLKPEFLIQSDAPKIIQQARDIVGEEKDSLKAALKIFDWVFKKIKKIPSLGLPSAISVLENKEGDCNEHAYLFVAFARASGIPAKIVTGLVYSKGRFYYHSWPKVFVGKWIELDPTLGQQGVSALHIRFLEGGIERQVEIIKLIRKLKINMLNLYK